MPKGYHMKIALDFDGTYTEDPIFWHLFLKNAAMRNHDVYIVTFRTPQMSDKRLQDLQAAGVPVFYTSRTPKMKYMQDLGIPIDVWIDDNPGLIVNESDWTEEQVKNWEEEWAKSTNYTSSDR